MIAISPAGHTPTECINDSALVSSPDCPLCTCRTCREEKPIEAFRILSKKTGRRDRQCRKCYNTAQRVYALRYYHRRTERERQRLTSALAQLRNPRKLHEVVAELVVACGGIEAVVDWWGVTFREAMESKPNSAAARRLHTAIWNMIVLVEFGQSIHAPQDQWNRQKHDPRRTAMLPRERRIEDDTMPDEESVEDRIDRMSTEELSALLAKIREEEGESIEV